MAFELIMPKLGESIQEVTITKWLVKTGDTVTDDQTLVELATEKVDSEIPSPVSGTISKLFYNDGDIVPVGKVIALIALEGEIVATENTSQKLVEQATKQEKTNAPVQEKRDEIQSSRFYSPLVRTIASQEKVSLQELENIAGTGTNNRVSKKDILNYISQRSQKPQTVSAPVETAQQAKPKTEAPKIKIYEGDSVVEMDRVRKLIADHMVMSKQVSPHVTNMLEIDVTNMVLWREKIKDEFQRREKEKLTYLPIFLEAIAKGLKEFPGVNASVDGYNVVLRKNVNLGVAVALPNGNLIVPVIKNADRLNLAGLTSELNRLANNARNGKLNPDDIQEGTFSITNFGSFKNLFGTPIINQPQVAIMAIGAIEKKPAVVETPTGDMIAIRHKCFLSMSYDHRVVDGFMGGSFIRKVADYIENFDLNRAL